MKQKDKAPIHATLPNSGGLRRGFVARCLHPQWRALVLLLALQIVQTTASLWLPQLSAEVIDVGVARADRSYVLRITGNMLVLSLVQVAFAIAATVLGAAA